MKGANKMALKKKKDMAIFRAVENIKNRRIKEHNNGFKKCYSV